jgi:hypothetical protein
MRRWWKALLVAYLAQAGCRATPKPATEDMSVDMAVTSGDDLAGTDDLAVVDMTMCAVGPEICNNGCDDDRNGYIDADDPACTSQMLVTMALGSTTLSRLILEPTPHLVVLDGNPVPNGGMASFNLAFAPAAFIAYDASTKKLERRVPGGASTTFLPGYTTRDVCVFNGELIVVDTRLTSVLHRFMADGKTEILPTVTLSGQAGACASDGKSLFVARHTAVGPSEIVIFDKGGVNGPVASALPPIPIPDALLSNGYDRIVDLAYIKKTGIFIGLFAVSGGSPDSALSGDVMAPWSPDGGSGPRIDGGIWHGVGEFLP